MVYTTLLDASPLISLPSTLLCPNWDLPLIPQRLGRPHRRQHAARPERAWDPHQDLCCTRRLRPQRRNPQQRPRQHHRRCPARHPHLVWSPRQLRPGRRALEATPPPPGTSADPDRKHQLEQHHPACWRTERRTWRGEFWLLQPSALHQPHVVHHRADSGGQPAVAVRVRHRCGRRERVARRAEQSLPKRGDPSLHVAHVA